MTDNGEVTITRARYEAYQNAEAELARLRKPVGEVKGVVRSLSLIACAPRCEHASECNCTVLDNAADLIQRLAGQLAEARGEADMANGAIHAVRETLAAGNVPTAAFVDDHVRNAIVQREAAEARLREAVEVIEPFAEAGRVKLCGEWKDHERFGQTDVNFHLTFGDLRRARAFLAELEDHSNG